MSTTLTPTVIPFQLPASPLDSSFIPSPHHHDIPVPSLRPSGHQSKEEVSYLLSTPRSLLSVCSFVFRCCPLSLSLSFCLSWSDPFFTTLSVVRSPPFTRKVPRPIHPVVSLRYPSRLCPSFPSLPLWFSLTVSSPVPSSLCPHLFMYRFSYYHPFFPVLFQRPTLHLSSFFLISPSLLLSCHFLVYSTSFYLASLSLFTSGRPRTVRLPTHASTFDQRSVGAGKGSGTQGLPHSPLLEGGWKSTGSTVQTPRPLPSQTQT